MKTPEEYFVEVNGQKEVWWEKTIEYDLTVNGHSMKVRIAENPKSTYFYEWDEKEKIWVDDITPYLNENMAIVRECYEAGDFSHNTINVEKSKKWSNLEKKQWEEGDGPQTD